jgi:uncharacterized protein (TIGR03435 family)
MKCTIRHLLPIIFAATALAQTKPSFEVATIRPSAPLDQVKMMAAIQKGEKLAFGVTITATRAEYLFMDLKSLLSYAYGVKTYQVTGPEATLAERFDIVAKLPDGAAKADAAPMLRTLLEDRFKLVTHRTTEEHPVLAIVAGKNGTKLKPSAEKPVPIDEEAPLQPGEVKMDTPDGPVRGKMDMATMSSVIDMGLKGKMAYKINPSAKTIHIDFHMTTLQGFAEMTTQLLMQLGGGTGGRRIIDMTGIQGNYDASLEISLSDMQATAIARDFGQDAPQTSAPGPGVAPDPGNGSTLTQALDSMGLRLESRKAPVEQFIVDHIEKTPTEN